MTATPDFRELTHTLYRAISAAPGERDWASVRRVYHPEARLVRTGLNPDGTRFATVMSLDAYIENVEALLRNVQFSEAEIGHEAEVFGNVARVTSLYAFTWVSPTDRREGRGVNYLTLIFEGGRWQVMSIVWDSERPGNVLPELGAQ
ncbi:MAG TPA: nuclear transport factor 2 family protein [Steroidobacteraceae bacterium]|nr:nuclear transport factor 2 family protein [Steroidobacteraceae bacterium]